MQLTPLFSNPIASWLTKIACHGQQTTIGKHLVYFLNLIVSLTKPNQPLKWTFSSSSLLFYWRLHRRPSMDPWDVTPKIRFWIRVRRKCTELVNDKIQWVPLSFSSENASIRIFLKVCIIIIILAAHWNMCWAMWLCSRIRGPSYDPQMCDTRQLSLINNSTIFHCFFQNLYFV